MRSGRVRRARGCARRRRAPFAAAAAALALALLASGCGLLRATANAPGNITKAVMPGKSKKEPEIVDPSVQQAELMRLCDGALQSLGNAFTDYAEATNTPEGRLSAARWRMLTTQRMLDTASRPDTVPALLDLVVLLQLGKAGFEQRLEAEGSEEAVRPILDALVALQERAWTLAGRLLDEEQLARARQSIDAWAAELGEIDSDAVLTPPSIGEIARERDPNAGSGLMSLLSIDPLAGLEPTTREIAEARLLGERTLFVGKHYAQLVRAQLELAALQAREQPETQELLSDLESFSAAAESFAKIADDLPAFVSKEREAALRQILDGLDAQREGLVRDLAEAQEPVDEILVSSRATLEAAQATSTRLEELVVAVGTFLDRFEEDPADPDPAPEGPPARPFDITEYGDAVTRLGDAARELTTLVKELDESVPELQRLVDSAASRGEATVDHAFGRALALGLALIAAAAAAAVVVRRVAPRRGA